MKPVLHSVSYAGFWGQVCLSLEDFIPHAAQLGYGGVMLTAKRPHLSVLDYDSERIQALKELLDSHGMTVACIAGYSDPGAGHSVTSGPFAPLGEAQLYLIQAWAQFARTLGAPVIRLMTGAASPDEPYSRQWTRSVRFIRAACDIAADFGVTVGVQNHDDIAGHYLSFVDFIDEVDRPNCKACFDVWSVALQDADPVEAVRHVGARTVHTTIADYVKRPRFRYHDPSFGNVYERVLDDVRAVPPGEGFIDHGAFFDALREGGFQGTVGFEMCSPLRGGGSLENLDRYARRFLEFIRPWIG
ncbi:MAG: sugar phosphate isomerase/epimerase [Acidobacteriota bacterium]|nr:MAG: sugar phosphate isomerase/epimerase [Acidobacteriota bacterium]